MSCMGAFRGLKVTQDSTAVSESSIDVYKRQVWGSHNKHIKADYFLERPADLLSAITSEKLY